MIGTSLTIEMRVYHLAKHFADANHKVLEIHKAAAVDIECFELCRVLQKGQDKKGKE